MGSITMLPATLSARRLRDVPCLRLILLSNFVSFGLGRLSRLGLDLFLELLGRFIDWIVLSLGAVRVVRTELRVMDICGMWDMIYD